LVSSLDQLEEFRRVTRHPRLRSYIQPAAAGTLLNEIKLLAVVLTTLPKADRSKDPADNFILAMAEAGQADYIVARDKTGLLELKNQGNTPIIPVHKTVEILEL
jgi:uncharacterized protein